MRTGTVLHGPHEGEIITADSCELVLPEPPHTRMAYCGRDPDVRLAAQLKPRHYQFRVDDDGRGWWVEDRVFGGLS